MTNLSGTLTLEQAIERLAKFQTTNGLAQFLKREGITMLELPMSRAYRCPLAMWLKKVLGEEPNSTKVTVGSALVYFGSKCINLPRVAQQFISRFDSQDNLYKFLRG